MAETRETKREGGARTRVIPMKRTKERVATCTVLETASLTGLRSQSRKWYHIRARCQILVSSLIEELSVPVPVPVAVPGIYLDNSFARVS